jgi:hypothetical protein
MVPTDEAFCDGELRRPGICASEAGTGAAFMRRKRLKNRQPWNTVVADALGARQIVARVGFNEI